MIFIFLFWMKFEIIYNLTEKYKNKKFIWEIYKLKKWIQKIKH